jgi:hypothetical protein
MSLSLFLVCLWVIVAALIGAGPKRWHWPAAWALIAAGVPLLGFVTWQHGAIWGLVVLLAGMSTLRWPVYYLWLWLKRTLRP